MIKPRGCSLPPADRFPLLANSDGRLSNPDRGLADANRGLCDGKVRLSDAERGLANGNGRLPDADRGLAHFEVAPANPGVGPANLKIVFAERHIRLANASIWFAAPNRRLADADIRLAQAGCITQCHPLPDFVMAAAFAGFGPRNPLAILGSFPTVVPPENGWLTDDGGIIGRRCRQADKSGENHQQSRE
jgi:hypothetical protein